MALKSSQVLDILCSLADVKRYDKDFGLNIQAIWEMLLKDDMELQGLMPWSSNYTFLVALRKPDDEEGVLAIYKPCQGERPLWDFPEGALCQREFATYLVSEVLGWPRVPPTVLREQGPHGPGTVQIFIDSEYEAHYFNMRHIGSLAEDFRQIALFDLVINNADRKGGHCLKDKNGQIWAIDHGLTFHADYKLRTVIWEFCNEPIPKLMLQDLDKLRQMLLAPSKLRDMLAQLVTSTEIKALRERLDILLASGRFPNLSRGRNVPYPPI